MCYQNTAPESTYRVTKDSYDYLTTLPYYKLRVTCNPENVHNDVCYCPSGYSGYLCETFDYNKCYVNVTEPALYKGCTGEDSDYYVYSIPGFAPCHFYDMTKKYNFKFLLQCKPL